jgi:hypothetical protein
MPRCCCYRFELRSLRPLAAGEEVTISYGESKPNCDLLRDYGFIMPGNVWDRVLPLAPDNEGHAGDAAAAPAEQAQPLVHLNPVTLLEVSRLPPRVCYVWAWPVCGMVLCCTSSSSATQHVRNSCLCEVVAPRPL